MFSKVTIIASIESKAIVKIGYYLAPGNFASMNIQKIQWNFLSLI
jgi:hypothetical protein